MKADILRVTTAAPDLASAKELARGAVTARLAGNAMITGPVVSVFRDFGEINEATEYQLALSTTKAALPVLVRHLSENHPWENPDITAIPLVFASDVYLAWLHEVVNEG
jgi:periplasmic divalent cation tolerance protein